jgi:hypothetical protein
MIIRKKGNDLFVFEDEQELKDFCADNKTVSVSQYTKINVNRFNKRTKRFDKISSDKL